MSSTAKAKKQTAWKNGGRPSHDRRSRSPLPNLLHHHDAPMTFDEIARQLGVTPQAVAWTANSAIAKIRRPVADVRWLPARLPRGTAGRPARVPGDAEGAGPKGAWTVSELCEWDPIQDQPARFAGIRASSACPNRATLSVGTEDTWHLCENCAALPAFRYRHRHPIPTPAAATSSVDNEPEDISTAIAECAAKAKAITGPIRSEAESFAKLVRAVRAVVSAARLEVWGHSETWAELDKASAELEALERELG